MLTYVGVQSGLNKRYNKNDLFENFAGCSVFKNVEDPLFQNMNIDSTPNIATSVDYVKPDWIVVEADKNIEIQLQEFNGTTLSKIFMHIKGFNVSAKKNTVKCSLCKDFGLHFVKQISLMTNGNEELSTFSGAELQFNYNISKPIKNPRKNDDYRKKWGDYEEYSQYTGCKHLGTDPVIKKIDDIVIELPFEILPIPIDLINNSNISLQIVFVLENLQKLITTNSFVDLEIPKEFKVNFSLVTLTYAKNTPCLIKDKYEIPFSRVLAYDPRPVKITENDKQVVLIEEDVKKYSPIINGFDVKVQNASFTRNLPFFGESVNSYMKNYIFSHFKFVKLDNNMSTSTIDVKHFNQIQHHNNVKFATTGALKEIAHLQIEKIDEYSFRVLLEKNNSGEEFWLRINSNLEFHHINFPKNLFFDLLAVNMGIREFSLILFQEITLIFTNITENDVLDQSISDGTDENLVVYVRDGMCAFKNLNIKLDDIIINKTSFVPIMTIPINRPELKFYDRSVLSKNKDVWINNPTIEGLDLDGVSQLPVVTYQTTAFKNKEKTFIDQTLLDIRNKLYDPEYIIKKPNNVYSFHHRCSEEASSFFDVYTNSKLPVYTAQLDTTAQVIDGGYSGLKHSWAALCVKLGVELSITQYISTKFLVKFSPRSGCTIISGRIQKLVKDLETSHERWMRETYGDPEEGKRKRIVIENKPNKRQHIQQSDSEEDLDDDLVSDENGNLFLDDDGNL